MGRPDVDRRHILSINGRTEIPKTKGVTVSSTIRYMSGAPFTIFDSNIDVESERRAQRSVAGRHLQRHRA